MDIELASFVEIKDVTPAFNVLWKQIITIQNDILWSKKKDGSLIQSLSEAAKLQCSK